MRRAALLWPVLVIAAAAGCAKPRVIPGTRVPESLVNRDLIEVMERYRRAMERRDLAGVVMLAHPAYHQQYHPDSLRATGGNDFGRDELARRLAELMPRSKSVRYAMQYRNVEVRGQHATVDVYLQATFQMVVNGQERWEPLADDKRFELLHDGRRWLILSGM